MKRRLEGLRTNPLTRVWIGVVFVATFGVAMISGGCGKGNSGDQPPAKPLNSAEADFVKQINALPLDKRKNFASKHAALMIGFATKNRTFGDAVGKALEGTEGPGGPK